MPKLTVEFDAPGSESTAVCEVSLPPRVASVVVVSAEGHVVAQSSDPTIVTSTLKKCTRSVDSSTHPVDVLSSFSTLSVSGARSPTRSTPSRTHTPVSVHLSSQSVSAPVVRSSTATPSKSPTRVTRRDLAIPKAFIEKYGTLSTGNKETKFYAIRAGYETGIFYDTWSHVGPLVATDDGKFAKGALVQGFDSYDEAYQYYNKGKPKRLHHPGFSSVH
ncbi:hypothetical protein ONZ45_g17136 [Pleurotus djamor]|nr:hypothetical protein ONZ45_g17136 [Pleurotus djamor]